MLIKLKNPFNAIILIFVIWRVIILLPLIIGGIFLSVNTQSDYTNILKSLPQDSFIRSNILYPWSNFDGVHYLDIAQNGYSQNSRFFPLYPIMIRLFGVIISGNHINYQALFISGLVLSNLFFALSLILLYMLIKKRYDSKVAFMSVLMLIFFPTSFFFASVYSESLFLFLGIFAFYLAEERKYLFSNVVGILVSVTRLPGIFIMPALVYKFITKNKPLTKISNKLPILLSFGLIPTGLLIFIYFNFIFWHDPFYFIKEHALLGNSRSVSSIVNPLQTVVRYFKILTGIPFGQYQWWISLMELLTFFFFSFLLYLAWKKRIDKSYLIFALGIFILPILSGTFSGLPRYVLLEFPCFLALALIENHLFKILYFLTAISTSLVLIMFFSRGYFVA